MAASAVFATPELLEMIFDFMPALDVVVSMRVCRDWKEMSTSSLKLKKKLFLVAAATASDTSPIMNPMVFGDVVETGGDTSLGPEVNVIVDIKRLHSARKNLKISQSYENMLICQPPVTEATLYWQQNGTHWKDKHLWCAAEVMIVHSKAPVTVRDLIDCVGHSTDQGFDVDVSGASLWVPKAQVYEEEGAEDEGEGEEDGETQ
ncbi:hypothetical protein LTR37_001579 [Vermiconidia calcicola]|uniref:Uncharacterized protein n=1 Tax=Vermiconidia calcicola TaxID=1690605 RepID=A0ACC3NVN0_9PEZI|nr:hypothetical protein LTR37_001579 [Vermiconidia calcicola]